MRSKTAIHWQGNSNEFEAVNFKRKVKKQATASQEINVTCMCGQMIKVGLLLRASNEKHKKHKLSCGVSMYCKCFICLAHTYTLYDI